MGQSPFQQPPSTNPASHTSNGGCIAIAVALIGALGTIAAAIVTGGFGLASGGHGSTPPPQQPSVQASSAPATTYPVNIQTNFLNACEASGPPASCQCALSWFEANIPLQQFEQDEAAISQGGGVPSDVTRAEQACA